MAPNLTRPKAFSNLAIYIFDAAMREKVLKLETNSSSRRPCPLGCEGTSLNLLRIFQILEVAGWPSPSQKLVQVLS
jgi:hypothetical protein